jgi:hypothetical protein
MLGMTTPIFTLSGLLIAPLFLIGPSLLIFSGITMIVRNMNRNRLCIITALIFIAALALWTVPRLDWRYSVWLILEPIVPALLVAWLGLHLLRKKWVAAAVGGSLSSPYTIFGAGWLVYGNAVNGNPFGRSELVMIVPGIFVCLSLLAALCFRME